MKAIGINGAEVKALEIVQLVPTKNVYLMATHTPDVRYACGHMGAAAFMIHVPERLHPQLKLKGDLSTIREVYENVVAHHHPKKDDQYWNIGKADDSVCPRCLVTALSGPVLQCCTCGEEILPGETVSFQNFAMEDWKDVASSVTLRKMGRFVGCCRDLCKEHPAHARWIGERFELF